MIPETPSLAPPPHMTCSVCRHWSPSRRCVTLEQHILDVHDGSACIVTPPDFSCSHFAEAGVLLYKPFFNPDTDDLHLSPQNAAMEATVLRKSQPLETDAPKPTPNAPNPSAGLPPMDCSPLRKAFEAWITAPPFERDITRNSDDATKHAWPGHYLEYEVQLAWDAWDAAAATIRETLADPAKTHVLMLRGDIAWTDAGLRHILGDSPENA